MRVWLVTALFTLAGLYLEAQENQYYVVVGAFAKEKWAKNFTGFVRRRHMECSYELNPERKLFYVFVLKAKQKGEAVTLAKQLQTRPEFFDAWVYTKLGSNSTSSASQSNGASQNLADQSDKNSQIYDEPKRKSGKSNPGIDSTESKNPQTDQDSANHKIDKRNRAVRGKLFRFEIILPNGDSVKGKIHHVNLDSRKDVDAYYSKEYTDILRPDANELTVICGIFGYREITKFIDYDDPTKVEQYPKDSHGAYVVPFHLEHLKPGDVSIMYDASFAPNGVALLASSIPDIEKLVSMMHENPTIQIIVHGHANGTGKRTITYPSSSKNYLQKMATSQELSLLRAKEVQNYLIAKGIDIKRIQTRGHGGQQMIVPESSAAKSVNDRIEIEIVSN